MSEVMDHPQAAHVELVDDTAQFFAPVSSDLLDGLLGQHEAMLARIDVIAAAITEDRAALHYFLAGNTDRRERGAVPTIDRLMDREGAVAALNATYWSKALALTDVYETMPKARRDEWDDQIREMTTPPFTEEAGRPTLLSLLQARETFFAERVDGIFRGLSGEHVTNSPEAFGKRMILSGMANEWGSYSYERAGLINDFRAVVAKFMGRDGEPGWNNTEALLKLARQQHGEWLSCDGGSWRLRVYLKGTAHLEVHPDMAWRLNCVLHNLYPRAIPAEFRAKPKKRVKTFEMLARPLPFAVLAILPGWNRYAQQWMFADNAKANAAAYKQAVAVVESIGGTVDSRGMCTFDYPPQDVLEEIRVSGCVPDRMAHQFYPTPETLARAAVDLAEIGEHDSVLEPSAGQGGIAVLLPAERTRCVEISALHCAVLKARGLDAVQADFIEWSESTGERFDRIVMNPPFSEGRWLAHTQAASELLREGGRLVAILPASACGKDVLPGLVCEWSRVYDNEFAGTSVSVAILAATREPESTTPLFAQVEAAA